MSTSTTSTSSAKHQHRGPLRVLPHGHPRAGQADGRRMSVKGKKPDEYARAFTSHPEPELLKMHDPEKFGCSPCHQGNGRATTSVEKGARRLTSTGYGRFSPRGMSKLAARLATPPTCCWSPTTSAGRVSEGKDLFRQRGCMGCHRYEGYDKEPEDLLSIVPADQTNRTRENGQPEASRRTS